MLRKVKVCALDQLLLERYGGKVGRGLALELSRWQDFSAWMESLFTPDLTGHSGQDESFDGKEHNARVQTDVCSKAKGVRSVDVATQPGRGIGRDISRGEAVEAELDRLVERRSRQTDPEEQSELWQASVDAYNALRYEEMRAAWCEHHQEQAARLRATLEDLIAGHEEQAARLAP